MIIAPERKSLVQQARPIIGTESMRVFVATVSLRRAWANRHIIKKVDGTTVVLSLFFVATLAGVVLSSSRGAPATPDQA